MDEWDSWVTTIRQYIVKTRSPLNPQEINKRIKLLKGDDIPFEKFQCKSLEEMLNKIPGVVLIKENGIVRVLVESSAETAKFSQSIKNANLKKALNTVRNKCPATSSQAVDNTASNSNGLLPIPGVKKIVKSTGVAPDPVPTPIFTKERVQRHRKDDGNQSVSQMQGAPLFQTSPAFQTSSAWQYNCNYQTNAYVNMPGAQNHNALPHAEPDQTNWTPNDPRLHLYCYAKSRNLAYSWKHLTVQGNVYAVVTVGQKKYSSYPRNAIRRDVAEKIAATCALEDLIGKETVGNFIAYLQQEVMRLTVLQNSSLAVAHNYSTQIGPTIT